MNKIFAISVLLSVGFVAGISWRELIAHAGGGGGTPVGNGDVNGDGQIDLSDAVYTLSWLFTGGNAPVAIQVPPCDSCCPPPVVKGLPATGQTKCYDTNGEEIDCASTDFPGQDGSYQTGCPREGRFVDHQDGTVTDTCTGLMWQQDTAPGTYNWQAALKYCEGLELAGQEDWRLPNLQELHSIVDFGSYQPAIDPAFVVMENWYWSSSTLLGFRPGYAWCVHFSWGLFDGNDENLGIFVRAVRNAQ